MEPAVICSWSLAKVRFLLAWCPGFAKGLKYCRSIIWRAWKKHYQLSELLLDRSISLQRRSQAAARTVTARQTDSTRQTMLPECLPGPRTIICDREHSLRQYRRYVLSQL